MEADTDMVMVMDMATAMAGQKHQVHPGIGAGQKLVRRLTPGAFDGLPGGIFQPVDLIDAGAADDAENGFGHEKPGKCGLPGLLAHHL